MHPDDLEPNLALFDPLVRGELPSFSVEKRFIRREGTSVWTHVTASVQRDAAGQPAYCIAIVQDISERKRLEAELSQAHARLELAVRGSNVRIWDVDMPDGEFQNGRMSTVNFWEHLGYGPETQAETTTAVSLLHPDDLEPALRCPGRPVWRDRGVRGRVPRPAQGRDVPLDAFSWLGRTHCGRFAGSLHR